MLGLGEIRDLLERHGLEARRSLGQNFVADPNTVARIARLSGVGPGDRVVEVGPGLGSLTLALADTGAQVLAVEKDRALLPVLREVLATADGPDGPGAAVHVVEGDALEVDWADLLGADEWVLVANLPYNVAVPVVMRVLSGAPQVRRLVVMVQLEVAERLCAEPGDRTIGIPSVKLAWWASARILTTVPPEVFVPRPRVQSAVVGIERHDPPSTAVGPAEVFPLVEEAYRQRRKMLRSTIGRHVDAAGFATAGIDPQLRPERLWLDDWVRLATALAEGEPS
ncbi:16S rRNA (adenine(1518)-N(6)/adenine(1519)-N(6))-dimethyltransferase RsmA [Dermatobacter hominis]|uniref:16S rRNA (adenine(1518)-N(6)/adenine(1519)-N(6))- dimethyltransferase RsmA n=1 Tax=Dermatobacter hominis TaxID=2884263 RepID=UPI001D0FA2DE|nr:16S rRNA (adenine(1518)-N(6)/adenine(1519)-N(6))-dimethyltransferase RsmA [Dermatobacter hominis]UDY37709.1 16S rRNA (adenine(1518)-N(6)/adenine(1519)-N(6))-dimethyltransferase RsmA [Dermatobacter hominis]